MTVLERYHGLVDDTPGLVEACQRSLAETVWMHPERRAAARLCDLQKTPLNWRPDAYQLRDERNEAFTRSWLLGGWHFQEESAQLAVHLLNPAPGERILDLCAAPGNKTAELALAVGLGGTVVANDVSRARAGVIQTTLNRLGLVNVAMTIEDGTRWPGPDNWFDAVLVDAPCSCEGTCRKNPDVLVSQQDYGTHQSLQIRLLLAAVRLVRPGGRICYSTCTFAPEENEAVLDRVLRLHTDLRVEPVSVDGLRTDPGITTWQGARYHGDVKHAVRLWPHRNDTGGFFAAIVRKAGDPDYPSSNDERARADGTGRAKPAALDLTKAPWAHLGLPPAISEGLGSLPGAKYDRLVSAAFNVPPGVIPAACGIPGRNLKYGDRRLSTAAAQFLAPYAADGWVDLPETAIQAFLDREIVDIANASDSADRMAVLLARSGEIGLGLAEPVRETPRTQRIQSLFPKIWGGR